MFVLPWCRGCKIAAELKKSTPGDGKLRAFAKHLKETGQHREDVKALRKEVHDFASKFFMPGN